jgi:hypothetical protein
MTRASLLPADVAKEIRGLAGPWLACLAVIVLGGAGVPVFDRLEAAAFFVGIGGLGALSIGQEYSYRTLPMLLAQPVSRQRVFLVKWSVLAVMLAVVTLLAVAGRDGDSDLSTPQGIALPFLCGLLLAPWLTMACRSPIAGAIFAFVLPGMIFTAAQLWFLWTNGRGPDDATTIRYLWWATLSACAVGAGMSWRTWMRLEAIDGGGPDLSFEWLRPGASDTAMTKRHPVWLLVKKELGLQQMSLALGGLYILGGVAAVILKDRYKDVPDIYSVMTFFYCGSLAGLIGMLASAEERQLGTHEWQTLLPIPAGAQWTVKVAVALTLAFLLAIVLPSMVIPFVTAEHGSWPAMRSDFLMAAAVLTSAGLYLSSLSTSGLRAMVLSLPAGLVVLLPVSLLTQSITSFGFAWKVRNAIQVSWRRFELTPANDGTLHAIELVLFGAVAAMLLLYAFRNHKSSEPAGVYRWGQMALVAVCTSAALMLLVVASLP